MTQKDFMPPNGEARNGVLREAKDVASHLVNEAKGEVGNRAVSQKDRAAESLSGVAQALRETRRGLDEKAPAIGQYADKAADAVEHVSEYIRNQTIGDVIQGIERFARREQALFLGGAVALGLLAGRFLKSSPRRYEGRGGGYDRRRLSYGREDRYESFEGESEFRAQDFGSSYGSSGYAAGSQSGMGSSQTGSSQYQSQKRTDPYGYGVDQNRDGIGGGQQSFGAYGTGGDEETDLDVAPEGEELAPSRGPNPEGKKGSGSGEGSGEI